MHKVNIVNLLDIPQNLTKSKTNVSVDKVKTETPAPKEVARKTDPGKSFKLRSTPPPKIKIERKEVPSGMEGSGIGVVIFSLVVCIAFYALFAFSLQVIAKKTNTPMVWFAWIPILNVVLMCKIARKPIWWLVLVFLPLINIIIIVILWMKIAETLSKPGWIGLLMLVPVANLIVPPYLAFTK